MRNNIQLNDCKRDSHEKYVKTNDNGNYANNNNYNESNANHTRNDNDNKQMLSSLWIHPQNADLLGMHGCSPKSPRLDARLLPTPSGVTVCQVHPPLGKTLWPRKTMENWSRRT